jgi:hypothetical protein
VASPTPCRLSGDFADEARLDNPSGGQGVESQIAGAFRLNPQ